MATVLVTDGDERAALAAVRSLGAAGHQIHVVSRSGHSIAGASRYCTAEVRLPNPLDGDDAFFRDLSTVLANRRAEVLIPITEASLRVILPRRGELEPAVVPFPPAATFQEVSNKASVLERARSLGIAEPTLLHVESSGELIEATRSWEEERYPLVLKPERSVVETPHGARKTSVRYARNPSELFRVCESVDPCEFPLLVQRRATGPGIGVFLFISGGQLVAAFAHRRIREKPPSGGVSVLRESVELPRGVLNASVALLRAFDWEGVAMVEYKLDPRLDEYVLMEVNGRFWGSLQLAIDAGVDFPRLLVDSALGKPLPSESTYKIGVQTRWLMGDLDHLIARLVKSKRALHLDRDAPGRARVMLDFLRAFFPPVRAEVFRWNDPRPAVREVTTWLRASVGSLHG